MKQPVRVFEIVILKRNSQLYKVLCTGTRYYTVERFKTKKRFRLRKKHFINTKYINKIEVKKLIGCSIQTFINNQLYNISNKKEEQRNVWNKES